MTNIAYSDHMGSLTEVLGRLHGAKAASLETRTEVTSAVCNQFNSGTFSPAETKIAAEILDILSYDIEAKVRKIISSKLAANPNVPKSLALRLANDVLEVALPVLEFSFVLSDDDITQIIRSTAEVARAQAIARRKPLSYRLVDELLKRKERLVVQTILENKDAYISPRSAEKILLDFRHSEDVLQIMVDRGNLHLELVERMIMMVSDKIRMQLVNEYKLSPEVVALMIEQGHDEALLGTLKTKSSGEADALVHTLHGQRKLNYNLVLRGLCKGDLEFFATGMGCLAGIPKSNVVKLIHDKNYMGFQALYKAANLPEHLYEASRLILQLTIQEREDTGGTISDCTHRIMRKIISSGYENTVPHMKYLLSLIGSSGNPATLH